MRLSLLAGGLFLSIPEVVLGYKTFVVPHTAGKDDVPAIRAALPKYSSDATILFKKGVTYNVFTPLDFGTLKNVEIAIEGNITLPTNIATIQASVAAPDYPGHWFKMRGTNVTLRGTSDRKWGWVDAHGQAWWDLIEWNNRPYGWDFGVTNGVLKDMKLWKPIAWSFDLSNGTNIHAFNNEIQARSNSKSFPFNTDGFQAAQGPNILIENNHIVNGDDCLTVRSGAKNVHFRNNYCEGGHGLSVGSLGKGGTVASVDDILIENTVMVNQLYGARFKSWTGGAGQARNLVWRNITVTNVAFPIYVTQNYYDQNFPKPNNTDNTSTGIDGISFIDIHGTQDDTPGYTEGSCVSDPCWYAVPNATGKEIIIFDLYPGTAKNVKVQKINIRPKSGATPRVMCDPTTLSTSPGFVCQNGPFRPR